MKHAKTFVDHVADARPVAAASAADRAEWARTLSLHAGPARVRRRLRDVRLAAERLAVELDRRVDRRPSDAQLLAFCRADDATALLGAA